MTRHTGTIRSRVTWTSCSSKCNNRKKNVTFADRTSAMRNWLRAKAAEFFSIDLRSLALFRITAGLIILVDLAMRMQDLRGHYTDQGVWPRALALREMAPRRWYFSLHLLGG